MNDTSENKIDEYYPMLARKSIHGRPCLIAHRFSTVRQADRILVIEQGRVIEDGSHEELVRCDGTYAHLFHLQAAGYLESASSAT